MSATFKLGLLSLFSSLENSSLEDKLNVLITFAQNGLSLRFIEVVEDIPYRPQLHLLHSRLDKKLINAIAF